MGRTTKTDLYLGLDIGTSSLKGIAVSATGDVLWRGTQPYDVSRPSAGRVEQDPLDWLRALERLAADIPLDVSLRISAIGADGHVPSLVLVDRDGSPLGPCLTWQDSRAGSQADRLGRRFGDPVPHVGTTLPWSGSQLPAKAAWVADLEPERAAATRHLLQPKDFLTLTLTGVAMTDAWGAKGLVHVGTGSPATAILEAAGWSPDHVPPVGRPWEVQGNLTDEAASRLGLRCGIPVVVGWTDAMASVLAVGGFDRPGAVVLAGTSEIVGSSGTSVAEVDGLYLVPDAVAPLGLSYGPTQLSGGSLLWVADTLGLDPAEALDLATHAQDGPTFTPYLRGERAPLWDPAVRGVFLGLDADHGRGELVRAVLEGVAHSARHVLDRSERATGTASDLVNVSGRGVDHPGWVAARASALGRPLRLHLEPNLAALGAAMLAFLGAGGTLAALDALRSQTRDHTPTPDQLDRGHDGHERYLAASRISHEWSHR